MLSVLLALPLQAQVHIDSVEVAHMLYGVPPQTSTNYTEDLTIAMKRAKMLFFLFKLIIVCRGKKI